MNPRSSFWMAFAIGLAVIAWVAAGFAGHHWIAFFMTLVIGATYLLGAHELRQYRADTAGLQRALALTETPDRLDTWLDSLPATLRGAVRQRVQDSRGGLPAPALTPYLVGLLVMLGMLGTFVGMVVTFRGAVFALEGSTDLAAIRAALAEPIRGLGLSFGASVAGVAGSAALGLMSAIARRERAALARTLDSLVAGVLRPYSAAWQREQALAAAQAHVAGLPGVVERLDALMQRIEQRGADIDERLLNTQARLHQELGTLHASTLGDMSREVTRIVTDGLAQGAQATGERIRPVLQATLERITEQQASALAQQATQDTQRLDEWAHRLDTLATQLDNRWQATARDSDARQAELLQRMGTLLERGDALVQARAASEAQWLAEHGRRMDQLAHDWKARLDTLRADEQARGEAAVQRLAELQAAVAQHLASLGAALEAPLSRLLATASEVPQAAAGVLAQLRQEMAHLAQQENAALRERTVLVERLGELVNTVEHSSRQAGELAAQAGASAVELAAWGEAFGHSVERFQASNDRLVAAMQQVEAAVSRSTARSDEQLAYYVAQAREVIDLSIASQHGVIERLRDIAAQPDAPARSAAATPAGPVTPAARRNHADSPSA